MKKAACEAAFTAGEKQKNCQPDWAGSLKYAKEQSALAELGSAAGGLQTVLFVVCRLKPLKTLAFFTFTSKITSIVTSKMGILFE